MKSTNVICDYCEAHHDVDDECDLLTVLSEISDEYIELHFCNWRCLGSYSKEKAAR